MLTRAHLEVVAGEVRGARVRVLVLHEVRGAWVDGEDLRVGARALAQDPRALAVEDAGLDDDLGLERLGEEPERKGVVH